MKLPVSRCIWIQVLWCTRQDAVALVFLNVCVCCCSSVGICCISSNLAPTADLVIGGNTEWPPYLEVLNLPSTLILKIQDEERQRGQKQRSANSRYYYIRSRNYQSPFSLNWRLWFIKGWVISKHKGIVCLNHRVYCLILPASCTFIYSRLIVRLTWAWKNQRNMSEMGYPHFCTTWPQGVVIKWELWRCVSNMSKRWPW